MPIIGFGTWTLNDEKASKLVYTAIKEGYRLIDTARYYGNEKGVGEGILKAISEKIVKREDIFITSKIMPGNYNNPDDAIDESLRLLGVNYIDLMLIHQPGSNDEKVYKALEKGVKSKKLKSIGISNYYTKNDFLRITKDAQIMPSVVQNENHIYYNNDFLKEFLKPKGIFIEAWYPFGGRDNVKDILKNEVIVNISKKYSKTPAQIILRWQIQSGYIVIPGSSNPEHIKENINIFDFELTTDEMKEINSLNKNQRFENW